MSALARLRLCDYPLMVMWGTDGRRELLSVVPTELSNVRKRHKYKFHFSLPLSLLGTEFRFFSGQDERTNERTFRLIYSKKPYHKYPSYRGVSKDSLRAEIPQGPS